MCNTYIVRPKRGAQGLAQWINEAAAKLAFELVRKSDPGVVVRADGRVNLMRWGFHREFNPAINNARSDKLEAALHPAIPTSVILPSKSRGPGGEAVVRSGVSEEHGTIAKHAAGTRGVSARC